MGGLWKYRLGKEKFLVVRRDGSVPLWGWFVLGAADPAAPAGLRAYADSAWKLGYDQEYVDDIRALAEAFDSELRMREKKGLIGNPTDSPHRLDTSWVVDMLKNSGHE